MVNHGLSKEEKKKFCTFFQSWFNSQNKFKLNDLSAKVNIPVSTLYGYLHNNNGPSNIEKANVIIAFIKNNQQNDQRPLSVFQPSDHELQNYNLKDDAIKLSQISELHEAMRQLHLALDVFEKQLSTPRKNQVNNQSSKRDPHIENIELLLLSLHSELIWFKNATLEDRKILRKSLKSKDVGYITSLLRSMMKGEDEINDWITATTYQLEMGKWKRRP